jgi:hypothetical protein
MMKLTGLPLLTLPASTCLHTITDLSERSWIYLNSFDEKKFSHELTRMNTNQFCRAPAATAGIQS